MSDHKKGKHVTLETEARTGSSGNKMADKQEPQETENTDAVNNKPSSLMRLSGIASGLYNGAKFSVTKAKDSVIRAKDSVTKMLSAITRRGVSAIDESQPAVTNKVEK